MPENIAYSEPRIFMRPLQILLIVQTVAAASVGSMVLISVTAGHKLLLPPILFESFKVCQQACTFIGLPLLIVMMIWLYRINKNTHALTPKAMEFSPGWAVGWWFIPFASLVQPLRIVAELYNANRNPENWRMNIPALLGLWWALMIAGILLGTGVTIARLSHNNIPQAVSAIILLNLALHQLLALMIYTRIGRWQRQARLSPSLEHVF